MANKKKTVTIIGLGLIGGSLAKALKKTGYTVYGITRNKRSLDQAKKSRIISKGSKKLDPELLNSSGIIIIATPLHTTTDYIDQIFNLVETPQWGVSTDTIITDVGSTKHDICEHAVKNLPKNITFIGGHPMAGSEHGGYKHSDPKLFEDATWVLTPSDKKKNTTTAIKALSTLIKKVGAKPLIADSKKHDEAVALISHFPVLVSAALCNTIMNIKDKKLQALAMELASSGFRDTTRIAGGNPEMNGNMVLSNINNIDNIQLSYRRNLSKLVTLALTSPEKLKEQLAETSEWKNNLFS